MTSRSKGARAELEVAALLQAWWQPVQPGCRFVRTPGSGGWHGRDGAEVRAGFRVSGDIATTATTWPFCVEVKRREGWTMASVLAGRRSPVWGWWRQAVTAAAEGGGLVPMLVMRRNREPWQCVLPVTMGGVGGFSLVKVPPAAEAGRAVMVGPLAGLLAVGPWAVPWRVER